MIEADNKNLDLLAKQISRIKTLCKNRAVDGEILRELEILGGMITGEKEADHSPLSAQLSIYPLRQTSLSQTINKALEVLQASGLKVIPGSMSTIILGNANRLWAALKQVFSTVSENGQLVMIVTLSNACPEPEE